MKYEVTYYHEIIAEEKVTVLVEAEDEEEAETKAMEGDILKYTDCETTCDYGDTGSRFDVENITLVEA